MNQCYVVTYQSYVYGEEVDDYKHMMQDGYDVKGVFTTEEKAKAFITKCVKDSYEELDEGNIFDDDKEQDQKQKAEMMEQYYDDDHYTIYKLELDKVVIE